MAKKTKKVAPVKAPVPVAVKSADADSDGYGGFLTGFQRRLNAVPKGTPLFVADASGLLVLERDEAVAKTYGKGLFLENIDQTQRQHYTCRACSRFVERFGNLVTIAPDGTTTSVFWDETDVPEFFKKAVKAIRIRVEKARVSGVFFCTETTWGTPATAGWNHMAASPSADRVYKVQGKKDAGAAMAEMKEEHSMLLRGLNDFSPEIVAKAEALLKSGSLFRAEKVIAQAEWIRQQHDALGAVKDRDNAAWLIAVSAPTGFCHIRSNMVGTLLQDIKDGLSTKDIAERFAVSMDPLRYRRATAAPSAGQVAVAQTAVEELGVVPSFNRRYVKNADYLGVPGAVVWAPSACYASARIEAPKAPGVFDYLKPGVKKPDGSQVEIPPRLMTWEKFLVDFSFNVAMLEYKVPLVGPFCALTTAADTDAPPILQWDPIERRNPVAWSFPSAPPRADEWNLQPGALVKVRHILSFPNAWHNSNRFDSHGKGIILLLDGAKDKRGLPGGGFFTEHLRSELAPYRATVEAHVNRLVVAGADEIDTTGFGVGFMAGGKWTELAAPKAVAAQAPSGAAPKNIRAILVIDDSGSMGSYIGAARAAVASLIAALRGMPGNVEATVIIFGTHTEVAAERKSLSDLEHVPERMRGNHGGTALNDAIIGAIQRGSAWPGAGDADTSYFLGIVTDGEEIDSRHSRSEAYSAVRAAQATGRWTVTLAGAGRDPLRYAREIGIPEGNATSFGASNEGFQDIGQRYSTSAANLGRSYAGGLKASTSFFSAAASRKEIGNDHPVVVATMKDGSKAAFTFDRWE